MAYASAALDAAASGSTDTRIEVRARVRAYIIDNFLLGSQAELKDEESLLDGGILDSTGAMELAAFLEESFGIAMADEDFTPDNLDTVERICGFVARKQAGAALPASV